MFENKLIYCVLFLFLGASQALNSYSVYFLLAIGTIVGISNSIRNSKISFTLDATQIFLIWNTIITLVSSFVFQAPGSDSSSSITTLFIIPLYFFWYSSLKSIPYSQWSSLLSCLFVGLLFASIILISSGQLTSVDQANVGFDGGFGNRVNFSVFLAFLTILSFNFGFDVNNTLLRIFFWSITLATVVFSVLSFARSGLFLVCLTFVLYFLSILP